MIIHPLVKEIAARSYTRHCDGSFFGSRGLRVLLLVVTVTLSMPLAWQQNALAAASKGRLKIPIKPRVKPLSPSSSRRNAQGQGGGSPKSSSPRASDNEAHLADPAAREQKFSRSTTAATYPKPSSHGPSSASTMPALLPGKEKTAETSAGEPADNAQLLPSAGLHSLAQPATPPALPEKPWGPGKSAKTPAEYHKKNPASLAVSAEVSRQGIGAKKPTKRSRVMSAALKTGAVTVGLGILSGVGYQIGEQAGVAAGFQAGSNSVSGSGNSATSSSTTATPGGSAASSPSSSAGTPATGKSTGSSAGSGDSSSAPGPSGSSPGASPNGNAAGTGSPAQPH